MGRNTRQFVLLTFSFAFFSCFTEVALGLELSAETTSSHHTATSAQPLYHSSAYQGTTAHFNSTGSPKTTPLSHRTTVQTTDQHQVTTAPNQNTTNQTGATTTQVTGQTSPMVVSTTTADDKTTVGRTTAQAVETVTPAVKSTSLHSMSSVKQATTNISTEMTVAATNMTITYTKPNTQMTTAAINTTATTKLTLKPNTASGNQTTAPKIPTATTMANTTTVHPGTRSAIPPTAMTMRPTPAPQPSHIPTGTYTIYHGNWTCIKAVMGLQLIAESKKQKWMECVTVNPNATQTSGSCGMVQSELNITFSGGFLNFTFIKQAPMYFVSKIETSLQLSSEGMLYHATIHEKLFTTKLGNSFKCASKQTFSLERNLQLLFVNMQLQAFDIDGNQFGEEEECFPDRNSRAAPVAVGLSILGLFVIVFASFLISRRKSHRGYERI